MRFSGVPTPKCENRGATHAKHQVHEDLIWHHRSGGKNDGKQHGGDAGTWNQLKIWYFLVSPHQNAKTVVPPMQNTKCMKIWFGIIVLEVKTMGNSMAVMPEHEINWKYDIFWCPHTKTRKPWCHKCTPPSSTQWFSLFWNYLFLASSDEVELRSVAETKCNILICKFSYLVFKQGRRSDHMGGITQGTPFMNIWFGSIVLEVKSMGNSMEVMPEHEINEKYEIFWCPHTKMRKPWCHPCTPPSAWTIDLVSSFWR